MTGVLVRRGGLGIGAHGGNAAWRPGVAATAAGHGPAPSLWLRGEHGPVTALTSGLQNCETINSVV